MNPDWTGLRISCYEVHNCSQSLYASTRNPRLRSSIDKKQKKIQRIVDIAKEVYDPSQTPQQFVEAILIYMSPWILRFLISMFERSIIDWLKNRIYPNNAA
jgi:hypothetical protein